MIILTSFRNLFDVIFTKIKCLKKARLAKRNYSKLLILYEFSEAATKEICENWCCECFSPILEEYLQVSFC